MRKRKQDPLAKCIPMIHQMSSIFRRANVNKCSHLLKPSCMQYIGSKGNSYFCRKKNATAEAAAVLPKNRKQGIVFLHHPPNKPSL